MVGVGAFDGFQTITPRGSRQTGAGRGANTGMNNQTSKGRGRGLGKGKRSRDSRRPSPAKSRVTSTGAAKGGPAHGTRIQPGQCLLCRQMGHLTRDCPNRGTRDDSGINLKRAFGSFVGMTRDRDVSSPVLTTTPQQEIVQYSVFNMSHVPGVIWQCFLVFVEQFLFLWYHQPALSSAKHDCSVGTQTEPESIPPSSPTQQRTPRTLLITENSTNSTKVFSLIDSLQHFESFDEGHIFWTVHSMSFTFGGSLCRVGSLCGGRRQRLCVAGHWSIQIGWRLHDGAICD